MKKYTIILAAGHGGADSGAVSPDGKHNERDQAITITNLVAGVLNKAPNLNVVVAPHSQDTHQTIPWINANYGTQDTFAFEIHRDSADNISEANGASTRMGIYHSGSKFSRPFADEFLNVMLANGAHRTSWSRNHKDSRFKNGLGWINQVKCRSFIIECAFMEGRNDADHIAWLAGVVAKSLLETFAN